MFEITNGLITKQLEPDKALPLWAGEKLVAAVTVKGNGPHHLHVFLCKEAEVDFGNGFAKTNLRGKRLRAVDFTIRHKPTGTEVRIKYNEPFENINLDDD